MSYNGVGWTARTCSSVLICSALLRLLQKGNPPFFLMKDLKHEYQEHKLFTREVSKPVSLAPSVSRVRRAVYLQIRIYTYWEI